jgi:hypothetical protein
MKEKELVCVEVRDDLVGAQMRSLASVAPDCSFPFPLQSHFLPLFAQV